MIIEQILNVLHSKYTKLKNERCNYFNTIFNLIWFTLIILLYFRTETKLQILKIKYIYYVGNEIVKSRKKTDALPLCTYLHR